MRGSVEAKLGMLSAAGTGRVLPIVVSTSAHAATLAVSLLALTAQLPDPAPIVVELQLASPQALAAAGLPSPVETAVPELAENAAPTPADTPAPTPDAIAAPTPLTAPASTILAEAEASPASVMAPVAADAPMPLAAKPVVAHAQKLHRAMTRPIALPPDQPPAVPAAPASRPVPAALEAPAPSPGWRAALAAWLAAHKRYPETARQQGQEGAVGVAFTVARDGRVERVAIERPSGVPALDRSVYAMLEDKMVPPFPDSMPQGHMDVRVTIRFEIER